MIVEAAGDAGVRLRAFRDGDVDDLVDACADPLIHSFLPLLPTPFTRADAERWVSEGAPSAFAVGGAAYAVADPDTDRLIGTVGLDRCDHGRRQAEIGYWTAPWARGRGVARAAVSALTETAFADGFGRLELLTDWANAASQRVALACGFTREGVRRGGAAHPDGGRRDLIVFARLADDPPGPVDRLLPDLPDGELTDGTVTLRPLTPGDIAFRQELASVPDVIATSVPPVPPDREESERRCTRSAALWLAGMRAELVIVDTASGTPAGSLGLFYQEPETGQAMIGYSMLPAWRGRGYASRAVTLVALWAFAETAIGRLIAGTLPDNIGSQRVLQRAGFRREGYLRSRLPGAAGGRTDDVQFALVAEDLLPR